MESRYLKTAFGKFHAVIVMGSLAILFLDFCYRFSFGKTPTLWGLAVSLAGFSLFLKAKLSLIRKGTYFSWGCDLMDQKNTYYYFFGWLLMVGGYFLCFY
jgi:hypothetical protein